MISRWKKNWKRICAGAAVAGLGFGVFPVAPITVMAEEAAMGRYLESDVALPEGFDIRDIVRLSDNTIRVVGEEQDVGYTIWDSGDGGESWERTASLPEEYADLYFMEFTLGRDGGVSAFYMDYVDDSDYSFYYAAFDGEGTLLSEPVEMESNVLQIADDGTLAAMDYGGTVTLRDRETGEIRATLVNDEADMIGVYGQELLVLTHSSQLLRYDITTGDPLDQDTALEEALFAGGESYAIVTSSSYPIVFADDGERIYYCTDQGIYSHTMGGSAVEQIADGSLNSLSDPLLGLVAMEVVDQVFYVVTVGDDGMCGLKKYEYSDQVSSMPSTELSIYSLEENQAIKQAILLYQKENPDIYLNYTYGMTGTDGVTASDALRTLNTEILAGNGPDILVLDSMSADTYIQKGLLADLSGILEEIGESEGLFENIAYAYEEDGIVPAVPALFFMEAAAGESAYLDRLTDASFLAELAKEQDALSVSNVALLPAILYPMCAGGWKQEDNTIDREKLAEYVGAVKETYDNYCAFASEKNLEILQMYFEGDVISEFSSLPGGETADLSYDVMGFLSRDQKLTVGSLNELDHYAEYTSVNRETGDCMVDLWNGSGDGIFVPYCVMGVSAASKEQESAFDFVKFMLSDAVQSSGLWTGFPVNRQAFAKLLETHEPEEDTNYQISVGGPDDTINATLRVYWPTQEELDHLEELASRLTVCAETECIQKEVVLENTWFCMRGEMSVDEAVDTIIQKLNLYLAE